MIYEAYLYLKTFLALFTIFFYRKMIKWYFGVDGLMILNFWIFYCTNLVSFISTILFWCPEPSRKSNSISIMRSRLWTFTSPMGNMMMRKRAESKSKLLKKNMRIEFFTKCIRDTKNNIMNSSLPMKMQRLPLISSGMILRTKSTVISNNMKPKWLTDIRKKSRKLKKILMSSSVQKSRKPQSCLIWEKWKNVWSNKRCILSSI